jgi:hypothetical protein
MCQSLKIRRWWWILNENWQRKPKYSESSCLSFNLSLTNPAWPYVGLNRVNNRFHVGKHAPEHVHSTYNSCHLVKIHLELVPLALVYSAHDRLHSAQCRAVQVCSVIWQVLLVWMRDNSCFTAHVNRFTSPKVYHTCFTLGLTGFILRRV